jgi:hypothetical protein
MPKYPKRLLLSVLPHTCQEPLSIPPTHASRRSTYLHTYIQYSSISRVTKDRVNKCEDRSVRGPVDGRPGVMSDWQCGVDRLLTEYCRCRLRLDLHSCRWRASAQGLSLAGPPRSGETSRLDGPGGRMGSSAGHMVARKARRSRGQEPVQGSGSRPESVHRVCCGSPQNHWVTWLRHKTKTEG